MIKPRTTTPVPKPGSSNSKPETMSHYYIVEKILDKKMIDGEYKYKVKWLNYPMSQCTWEPKENLSNVGLMLKYFDENFEKNGGANRNPQVFSDSSSSEELQSNRGTIENTVKQPMKPAENILQKLNNEKNQENIFRSIIEKDSRMDNRMEREKSTAIIDRSVSERMMEKGAMMLERPSNNPMNNEDRPKKRGRPPASSKPNNSSAVVRPKKQKKTLKRKRKNQLVLKFLSKIWKTMYQLQRKYEWESEEEYDSEEDDSEASESSYDSEEERPKKRKFKTREKGKDSSDEKERPQGFTERSSKNIVGRDMEKSEKQKHGAEIRKILEKSNEDKKIGMNFKGSDRGDKPTSEVMFEKKKLEKPMERQLEKPILIEKPMQIEKPIQVEKQMQIERPLFNEKPATVVEKPSNFIVEKPTIPVEKRVEKPIEKRPEQQSQATKQLPPQPQTQVNKPPTQTLTEEQKFGDFAFGDVAKCIIQATPGLGEEVMCLVEWLPRKDGYLPRKSKVPNTLIKKHDPNLLVSFYESKLKFNQGKGQKSEEKGQEKQQNNNDKNDKAGESKTKSVEKKAVNNENENLNEKIAGVNEEIVENNEKNNENKEKTNENQNVSNVFMEENSILAEKPINSGEQIQENAQIQEEKPAENEEKPFLEKEPENNQNNNVVEEEQEMVMQQRKKMDFCQQLSRELPSNTSCWTYSDFQTFLRFVKLEEYGPNFDKAKIDGTAFLDLKESDMINIGVDNMIARMKLIDYQSLLPKFNQYVDSLEDQDPVIQPSIAISQNQDGFLSNAFGLPKGEQLQTPDPSQMGGFEGGFGFGNVDFFMSGKLELMSTNREEEKGGIEYNPAAAMEKEEGGSYAVLQSHYHVKDYKQERQDGPKKDHFEEDEDLKSIEYAESRIVPREEIKRQQKFNYLNMPKKDLNTHKESPSRQLELVSEVKLQNLNTESLAYSVKEQPIRIGSNSVDCQIVLSSGEVSASHCEIFYKQKEFFLKDLGSKTGTWVRVAPERPMALKTNTPCFLEVGQGVYRLEVKPGNRKLEISNEQNHLIIDLKEDQPITIGKLPSCTISLPGDQCLSKLHCKFSLKSNGIFIEDCKSTNGTWLKVDCQEGVKVEERAEYRIGNQSQRLKVLSIFIRGGNGTAKKCLACNKEEVKTVIEPCLHVVLCGGCAKTVRICPLCGGSVDQIIVTG